MWYSKSSFAEASVFLVSGFFNNLQDFCYSLEILSSIFQYIACHLIFQVKMYRNRNIYINLCQS